MVEKNMQINAKKSHTQKLFHAKICVFFKEKTWKEHLTNMVFLKKKCKKLFIGRQSQGFVEEIKRIKNFN